MDYVIINITLGKKYINALYTKYSKILVFKEQFNLPISKKLKKHTQLAIDNPIHLGCDDVVNFITSEQSNLEYAISTANTFFDLLLQVINSELLHQKYHESKVYYDCVYKELKKESKYKLINSHLSNLHIDNDYQYISAYTNTSKHRGDLKSKSIIRSDHFSGPVICSFEKDGVFYDECDWKTAFLKIDNHFSMINNVLKEVDQLI